MVERRDGDDAFGRIWTVYPFANGSGYQKTLLVSNAPENCTHNTGDNSSCISHGIAYYNNYLYASSDTTVYRWRYTIGTRSNLGAYEIAITNIPAHLGMHETRSLVFTPNGYLFVTMGSQENIDPIVNHSEIRRFYFQNITSQDLPIDFANGLLWVFGVRNEVGITLDNNGQLWGVEPSIDNLYRTDLGGDISLTNPSEELNFLRGPAAFYGYPYCFSEYELPEGHSRGPGSQWAINETMDDGVHNDSWCEKHSIPPVFNLPPHGIPLGLVFYYGKTWSQEFYGDVFVARHGGGVGQMGKGRRIEGYDVVYVDIKGGVAQDYFPIIQWNKFSEPNITIVEFQSMWHRFVNVQIGPCLYAAECIYVSSDNEIGILGGSLSVLWRK